MYKLLVLKVNTLFHKTTVAFNAQYKHNCTTLYNNW